MKKWALILAATIVVWLAAKDIAYSAYLRFGEPATAAQLDYSELDSWATRPAERPIGAWGKPWGIDAFLILPPANVPAKHGLMSPDNGAVLSASLGSLRALSKTIPGEVPVYAPLYRAPAPASTPQIRQQSGQSTHDDLTKAFEKYLGEDNRGRGIMLLVAEDAIPFAAPLVTRLQTDELKPRFAGLITFAESDNSALYGALECADILDGACHQDVQTAHQSDLSRLIFPNFASAPASINGIDKEGVAEAIRIQAENVSIWLDETQPKPAEPFSSTQIIEVAPVYRVGGDAPINTDPDTPPKD